MTDDREFNDPIARPGSSGDFDPFSIPVVGETRGDTTRRERCRGANGVGLACGREKDHDGDHSVHILNTDRVYTWPRKEGEA